MPSPKTLQRLAKALAVGIMFTGEGVMVVPLSASKPVMHNRREYAPNLWAVPMQKTAYKRHKIEGDSALLRRMTETGTIARRSVQKETANAGLEIAA